MSLRRMQTLRLDAPTTDEDVWATSGDDCFSRMTCLECGEITHTWAAFLAHRKAHHAGTVIVRRRGSKAAA